MIVHRFARNVNPSRQMELDGTVSAILRDHGYINGEVSCVLENPCQYHRVSYDQISMHHYIFLGLSGNAAKIIQFVRTIDKF